MDKKKVLIVEDDNFVAEVYLAKLSEMGYETVLAQNGEEGLAELKRGKIDLILLDILMPIMNGIEMLEQMKRNEEWKSIPVILLTNIGEKESIQKVREMGVKNYLIKSHFTPAEVIEKIESVFRENEEKKRNESR
jgi:DNA-binding response OmpR family regulator